MRCFIIRPLGLEIVYRVEDFRCQYSARCRQDHPDERDDCQDCRIGVNW
ncbi:hypothetical protein Poly21_23820 [Allorhodopirellula heiligendammensis]|uniref:C3H1-type domain-containing protein n=1 Tax=Allorhodopirellula heiligendammensis TaxID=2714739 RepID=A0A5C6BWY4_9BACT|nr:hypothetical protein Poly21_23820 [Allorhodopirellula heiligendammensis]